MKRPRLKRFMLEIVWDKSFFERDLRNKRNVFRYRTECQFVPLKAKNRRNAKKLVCRRLTEILKKENGLRVDERLYEETHFNYERSLPARERKKRQKETAEILRRYSKLKNP